MTTKDSTRKGTTRTRQPKDWQCQECGREMTQKQAEKAVNGSTGCPGCGGSDIDMKVELAPPVDKRRRPARAARPRPEGATSTGRLRKLLLDRIYANPDQPRKVRPPDLTDPSLGVR